MMPRSIAVANGPAPCSVAAKAEEGDRGVACMTGERPDLVITNLLMPGQEGIATIQQIRELDDKPPIIAISGMWGIGGFSRSRAPP
jgi:YesN/AraC family two-component response regulator